SFYANSLSETPIPSHIAGTPDEDDDESVLAAPLMIGGTLAGAMTIWRKHEIGLFTDEDMSFLTSVSRQVPLAIESARLYLQTERRAEEMAALAEVGREISATLELDSVLNLMASHASRLLNAGSGAVWLLQPDGRTLRVITAVGNIADLLTGLESQLGE